MKGLAGTKRLGHSMIELFEMQEKELHHLQKQQEAMLAEQRRSIKEYSDPLKYKGSPSNMMLLDNSSAVSQEEVQFDFLPYSVDI